METGETYARIDAQVPYGIVDKGQGGSARWNCAWLCANRSQSSRPAKPGPHGVFRVVRTTHRLTTKTITR